MLSVLIHAHYRSGKLQLHSSCTIIARRDIIIQVWWLIALTNSNQQFWKQSFLGKHAYIMTRSPSFVCHPMPKGWKFSRNIVITCVLDSLNKFFDNISLCWKLKSPIDSHLHIGWWSRCSYCWDFRPCVQAMLKQYFHFVRYYVELLSSNIPISLLPSNHWFKLFNIHPI